MREPAERLVIFKCFEMRLPGLGRYLRDTGFGTCFSEQGFRLNPCYSFKALGKVAETEIFVHLPKPVRARRGKIMQASLLKRDVTAVVFSNFVQRIVEQVDSFTKLILARVMNFVCVGPRRIEFCLFQIFVDLFKRV